MTGPEVAIFGCLTPDNVVTADGACLPQTFGGNEHRGAVNGPGLWRFDFSLVKSTQLMERLNMQFRVDAFNLFNHTNFSTINTTTTSSLFGQVTGTRDPRTLQLAVKFLF